MTSAQGPACHLKITLPPGGRIPGLRGGFRLAIRQTGNAPVVKFLSYRHLAVVGELQAEVVALRQVEVDAHLVKELLPHGALLQGGGGGGKKDRGEKRRGVEGGRGAGGGRVMEKR